MPSSEEEGRTPSDLNRTAAYRFIAPPRAGRQATWAGSGPDLAKPGQIRPARLSSFSFSLLKF
jgi:hypothetical protein